jgi:hypothetical protein
MLRKGFTALVAVTSALLFWLAVPLKSLTVFLLGIAGISLSFLSILSEIKRKK